MLNFLKDIFNRKSATFCQSVTLQELVDVLNKEDVIIELIKDTPFFIISRRHGRAEYFVSKNSEDEDHIIRGAKSSFPLSQGYTLERTEEIKIKQDEEKVISVSLHLKSRTNDDKVILSISQDCVSEEVSLERIKNA